MSEEEVFYQPVPSAFGSLAIVWRGAAAGPRVIYIFLPRADASPEETVRGAFPHAVSGVCEPIADLGRRLQRFLEGEDVVLALDLLALDRCSPFQQRVLRAEYGIPRGRVSTYGRVARRIGVPKAARAVGNALAQNPFPLVIPCHRAVRSDGQLGGFRGGLQMKAALLRLEGVEILSGKVITDRFYY
jgi:methylated-DNA-[protein]-cysteine S-methyltransferase